MAILVYFYHNKTQNYSWNQCRHSWIEDRAAVEQQSHGCWALAFPSSAPSAFQPLPSKHTPLQVPSTALTRPVPHLLTQAILWGRKGSSQHCPVHRLLLPRKYLLKILFCSLLTNSAGLAKAHEDVPYLTGLKSYTLGNQQIKQMRGG